MQKNRVKQLLMIALVFLTSSLSAQKLEQVMADKKGAIDVVYFQNEPYAYKNAKGQLVGIEIDIMNSFVNWMEKEKNVKLTLNFIAYEDFNKMLKIMGSENVAVVGLGSVTITEDRMKMVDFSAPYLKNVSVLVTDGAVPTARTIEALKEEVLSLTPVTVKGSVHEMHLKALYKEAGVEGKEFVYVTDGIDIPKKIKESGKYYGYVDIITFWKYLKSTENHYIKMHSIANRENEYFGFVFPKGQQWQFLFNEFFESGFGFTATKEYHAILEKHLGFEIMDRVELD